MSETIATQKNGLATDEQLDLFAAEMKRQLEHDYSQGAQHVLDLGVALRDAEDRLTDNMHEIGDVGPWDRVDDQMEIVYRDPDAMRVAAELGLRPTEFGLPLLGPDGVALQSSDILDRMGQTRDHGIGR